ncbi:MAG: dynamin family protein [Chromatiales bacterium]|nr:dynamin family protein [Chromatiales bacterium]
MQAPGSIIEERLSKLESHLELENPVLLKVVQGFRELDKVAHRMGLLEGDQSYAMRIPWWPLISILGTFSAGKSSFINTYLGAPLQRTGNQAVDDKFSVICFTTGSQPQTLPGVALDSDPRFPFYQISKEIDLVAVGEGRRIDAYLQLKTSPSERLRGKILIDSPGFDADSQRTSTLRITDHIVNLSDLVLVFFDARHPEPGAMQDTLRHLVTETVSRPDSEKFLYILNQLDTAAREDNPEEVIASWQRGLAEAGLTAGRFYTIYNPEVSNPIDDENLRRRFEGKRDADLAEINSRMEQVEVQRAYRIVTALEKSARDIEERVVPELRSAISKWKKRVLWGDGILLGGAAVALGAWGYSSGLFGDSERLASWRDTLFGSTTSSFLTILALVLVVLGVHYLVRRVSAASVAHDLAKHHDSKSFFLGDLASAFRRNTVPWRSIFTLKPRGWGKSAQRQIRKVVIDTDHHIQTLNDKFTNPSGTVATPAPAARPQPNAGDETIENIQPQTNPA